MGSQRRPFREEMGPQVGLGRQEKNQLMIKIRQCTRMERRNAEVKVSKVQRSKCLRWTWGKKDTVV